MVNQKDVAQKVGVSTATVSAVVNGNKFVTNELNQKVKTAIKELGYKPNLIARGLKRNSMNLIGVIIPDVSKPSWAEVIDGMCTGLIEKEYYPVLFDTKENKKTELEALEIISSMLISGILLIPSHLELRDYEVLNVIKHPLIVIGSLIPGMKKDYVIFDNVKGAYDATNYLINNGHKKIVLLNGEKNVYSAQCRYKGWKEALDENNLYDSNLEFWGNFSIESGYRMMKKALRKISFSAVFAGNDLNAIGAKKAIEDEGLKIPDNISIIGFDDIFASRILNPPLTTVKLPLYDLGRKAADLIIARIGNSEGQIKQVKLNCKLIERSSVKKIN